MKAIFNNRYLSSVVKTILFLAIIHFFSLCIYIIKTGNFEALNIFNITGVNYLLPELGVGRQNLIISLLLLLILYVIFFFL